MIRVDLGVYIHYPWCRSRCPYCDFAVAVAPLPDIPHEAYLTAILDELAVRGPDFTGRRLVSIYVGGGTPSLWPTGYLARAIDAVRDRFGAAVAGQGAPLEVTVEANPADCTPENLAGWRAAGIDRLSIGVQSIDAGDLVTLGRDHRMGDGPIALDAAAEAGFARVSADVILGAPGSADPLASVDALAARVVPHLSVYELTVEPGTPLAQRVARGEVVPESEDHLADLYTAAHERLTARGYEHYEVSSYARPGQRAIHNSLYWRTAEYLGLGCGAASFAADPAGGGRRWTNHRSVGRYLAAGPGERRAELDEVSPRELAADRVWLGLRTRDGVAVEALDGHAALRDWLLGPAGLAQRDGDRIRPTLRGFLCSSAVMRRVLEVFRHPQG